MTQGSLRAPADHSSARRLIVQFDLSLGRAPD
jgi:hypothetical protein